MSHNATLTAALLAALTLPVFAQRAPTPVPTGLSPEVLALACAPRLALDTPPQPLRVTGGQDSFARVAFAPGDLVTVNAGTVHGIEVGQEYFVRRVLRNERRDVSRGNPGTIHTAGWIRIYAVDNELSLATISYACDSIQAGDFLEPFRVPEVPPMVVSNVQPQRSNYGRVLIGADGRRSFGLGDFFIVDRGSDHGVSKGAQFVIYRDKLQAENFLFILGEAVAVDVTPESSTLLVTMSRDGIINGDLVALRK